jgi:hypothetical protein
MGKSQVSGSFGPEEANELLKKDGRFWWNI